MLFSILIANYNNGHFFKDCYDSILNQTYTNWECIIVDDGSTDDSVQIIKQIVGNDSRFRFFENDKNYGCGFTKRRCVELANGEICGFLDPDDALENNALEIMVEAHISNPSISLAHSKWASYNFNWNFIEEYTKGNQVQPDVSFYNHFGEITHFASFKKRIYDLTDGINGYLQRAVDLDLYLKLVEVGDTLFIDDILYKYRMHEGGISTFNNEERAFFWRWMVNYEAAKRRNVNLEDDFLLAFAKRNSYEKLSHQVKQYEKSRWIKLGKYLGFVKAVKS